MKRTGRLGSFGTKSVVTIPGWIGEFEVTQVEDTHLGIVMVRAIGENFERIFTANTTVTGGFNNW